MYGQYMPLSIRIVSLLCPIISTKLWKFGRNYERVRLSGNINLIPLQGEGVDEVLPESHELLCYIRFICGGDITGGKACADGLFNPNNIGKMMPGPRIRDRFEGAILPQERPVFLKKAFKRRAPGLRVYDA